MVRVIFIAALLAFPCLALASEYSHPKFLSYEQLLRLPPANRAQYREGLIQMLDDLERTNKKNSEANAIRELLLNGKELLSQFQFLPIANAGPACDDNEYLANSKNGPVCVLRDNSYSINEKDKYECASGYKFSKAYGPQWCVKDQVNYFNGQEVEEIPSLRAKPRSVEPKENSKELPKVPKDTAVFTGPDSTFKDCPKGYETWYSNNAKICYIESFGSKDCPTGHRSGPKGICILIDEKDVVLAPKPTEQKSPQARFVGEDNKECVPNKCSNEEAIEPLKAKAYPGQGGNQEKMCINAGAVTAFDFSVRLCPPVLMINLPGGPFRCTNGQTICMPLVFGTTKENKALCVPISDRTTRACAKKRDDLQQSGQWNDLMKSNQPGLQEAWDKWVNDLSRLCITNQNTGAYHCTECQILAKYVSRLNKLSMSPTGQCGDIKPGKKEGDTSNVPATR